jgi:hypothetical protein
VADQVDWHEPESAFGIVYAYGSILEVFNASLNLQKHFENSYCEEDDRKYKVPTMLAIDAIDDLFDRG